MVKSAQAKPSALIKPTLDTQFHIDYSWWERNTEEDLRTYKLSQLPPDLVDRLTGVDETRIVDYIDPETAEVRELDAIGLAVQEAAARPDFIGQHVSMVDCIFRVFLANGNQPLTPIELSAITDRPAQQILRTLGGTRVYKGIRPVQP
ncbi:MAG: hypothetical protein ACUVS2_08755 [Candidatus Flexifilum sp.]|jgi:hypothetical protein